MKATKVINNTVFKDLWASIGTEDNSGKYVLSLPEASGFLGYLEYHEISREEYQRFLTPEGRSQLAELVEGCRKRLCDDRLMEPRPF